MAIYLITPAEIKEGTPMSINIDDKMFRQSIIACQDIYVQKIVGTGLLNELKTQKATPPMSALNTTLLNDYLLQGMQYWIQAEMVRPMAIRAVNVGLQTNSTDHSQPISEKALTTTEDYFKNRAEFYATRAYDYLCENSASYPLFLNPGDGHDIVRPENKQYKSTLIFGDEKKTTH